MKKKKKPNATKRKSKAPRSKKPLTKRELECLYLAADGKTANDTAKILGINGRTVVFHIQNAMHKLNAKNRTHAVAIAVKRELIGLKI